jgi:hypothetical protein
MRGRLSSLPVESTFHSPLLGYLRSRQSRGSAAHIAFGNFFTASENVENILFTNVNMLDCTGKDVT